MLVIAHFFTLRPPSALEQPETTLLYLPSELLAIQLSLCTPGLTDLKKQLCKAQCSLSLLCLCDQLFIKTQFLVYKGLHLHHQAANTRACTLFNGNKSKIRLHAEKYRDARAALLRQHNGEDTSCFKWKELKQEDIQCMEDPEALKKCAMNATPGESMHKLSWIWMAATRGAEDDARMHDGKQISFILLSLVK